MGDLHNEISVTPIIVPPVDVPTENHFLDNGAVLAEIAKRFADRKASQDA